VRVAVITTLSLPRFVSGATLQVHRLALGLSRRGHDVAVLSGGRRPIEKVFSSQTDTVDGVTITSLNTEPYFGFTDPLNYDNPKAVKPVLGWLEAFAPDVIHAHSIQGLGAAWLEAAARLAPVVVTMHDWWWICARQFLVTEEMTVDGPLLQFDRCECAGGVEFNQARRAWLATQLSHATRVLVPSEALRQSLVINGYDPERVEVNQNGVAPSAEVVAPTGTAPLLGFVGGAHDFKGFPLLVEARRRLPAEPIPFHLTCWGAVESADNRDLPPGVEVLPAYSPDQTDAVMAGLDALAVPSLMRESFSLVTAEALARGVPVICSDSGGPEELVRDGENGLVLESDSPAAWALGLQRWAADSELRGRLRAGAARSRDQVSVEDQVGDLEEVFQQSARKPGGRPVLFSAGRPAPPDMVMLVGIEGAPLRYRGYHLLHSHRALGGRATVMHYRDQRAFKELSKGGLVVFYRVPWSTQLAACLAVARTAGATIVFSVDDLIFDPSLRHRIPALKILAPAESELWMEGVHRYQNMALACGLFIASTPTLMAAAEKQGLDAFLHPNSLGREIASLSQAAIHASREDRARREAEGVCRIGYLSGSTTHDHDWAMVEPAVLAVLERYPKAELWLMGPLRTRTRVDQHPRIRVVAFRPFQELPRLQAELDIVLAPLEPDLEFSEAKSAVKWIEASALGIPVVASPTGPFKEVIEDGVTGLLAEPGEWEAKIATLLESPELRRRLGRAARRAVYRDHGPWMDARRWAETWPRIVAAGARRHPTELPDEGPYESPAPTALEAEAPELYVDQFFLEAEYPTQRLGMDRVLGAKLDPLYPRLCRIDVKTTAYRKKREVPLFFRLLDSRGTVVREGAIDPVAIAEDGWTAWTFDAIPDSAGREFTLELRQPGAARDMGASVWSYQDWGEREVDGRRVVGQMCLRTWAQPTPEEISAVAMGRRLTAPSNAYKRWRRSRLLWRKGRLALHTEGVVPTAFRVTRFGQREVRGRLRRR
jgi:glycosyltransferase involved in cell wall biosynthesis